MTKEQVTKKLKALKALTEQGVGGEKEDARRLYDKLKSKYGISEEELPEKPQEQPEKPFDGDTMFQAAAAATMLKAEKQEVTTARQDTGRKNVKSAGRMQIFKDFACSLKRCQGSRKGEGSRHDKGTPPRALLGETEEEAE